MSCLKSLYLSAFWLCSVFYRFTNGRGFNSLLFKAIDANVTCGRPAEIYFRTQEGELHPRLRTPLVCDALDPENSHPPEYMVDDNLGTFWQSKASIDRAEIRIDLNQEVYGYELTMTFGDYRRPGQIAFYKSKDFGTTFEPWHFLVSAPALQQCRDVFNMPVTYNPQQVNTVICQQYPSYSPLEYNETFSIDMNGRQRGDGSSSDYHSSDILNWMNITNLMIVFTGLYQKFDRLSTAWHHYTVREVGLTAKCNCHGYADGFDCPLDPVTKQRKCSCQGNTCGLYCQQCCPAHNQYPWQPGNGAPWVWNGTASCKACNCHNHSEVCVYDQNIADRKHSLDAEGQYAGGGVCMDCKHNTDGVNCEKCKTFYYRPVNESRTSPDSCKECACNVAGTIAHLNMTYLDCVRDESAMKLHVGKRPGDCYCKQNVIGRTCDTCKDEFYHLTQENGFGCKGCQCFLPGTANRSNICQKDEVGQCLCKENTRGRNCMECKPGYYNIRDEDVSGCEDCRCDPGASVPGTFCNNVTGTCQCLPHIYGKQCKSIEKGCYYPDLHYISAEKSIYEQASPSLSVMLDIPKTGFFLIMIRYTLQISDEAQVSVVLMDDLDGSVVNSTTKTLLNCLTFCYHKISSEFLHLEEGEILVLVNSTTIDLKLDKVIAIPREFYLDTILGKRASSHFQFQCNIDENDMGRGTALESFCLSNVFSLTIAYNGHPFNCSCDPVGSYNHTTCEPHGGQCDCKPGVTARDCSQCLPEFYGFSSSGCDPCACQGIDKQCNVTTGWCNCPINTALRTCEKCQCNGNSERCLRSGECLDCQHNTSGFYCQNCIAGTYGNASAADCQDCNCHTNGSIDAFCDSITGQCRCKTNVIGRDCSQCHVNAYNMSADGCMQCTCNADGSSSLQCDDTGQCPCLDHVTGLKCTQCATGFYGLPAKPCQACECSRVGSVNGTVCTNDELGMCVCKPGVSGRACDSCQMLYTNLSSAGCTRCPACPRNLQYVLNGVVEEFLNVSTDVEKLQNFTDIGDFFKKTTARIVIAKNLGDEYSSRIRNGKQDCEDLLVLFASDFSSRYVQVSDKNTQLSAFVPFVETQTKNALEKFFQVRRKTDSSQNYTEGVHEFLQDIVLTFINLVESSTVKYSEAKTLFQHLSNINLDEDVVRVNKTFATARNLSQVIGNISEKVLSQEASVRLLQFSVDRVVKHITETQNDSFANHEKFMKKIKYIYGTFSTASELVESIQTTNEKSRTFIEKATRILDRSGTILHDAREYLSKTELVTQQLRDLVIPVSGELEISMLQYDFTESVFLMKILQARDLLGRDLPSRLSDPYAVISIIPAWRGQKSQRSRIINGTLSPVFPFYDIFRFNIKVDEIPQTKVLISLFHYDADDADDVLGEVVIPLFQDDFFNRIVTKWFTVQPKGTTQLNTGDFHADGIGLVDMNVLLKLQIEQMKPELAAAETKVAAAKLNATDLQNIVDSLNRSLQEALRHTKGSMNVLSMLNTVSELVNETAKKANETKKSIDNLMNYLRDTSVKKINNDFNSVYKENEDFYKTSLLRNSSKPGYLQDVIESANQTFRSVVPLWRLISQHLPHLQAKTSQFQAESLQENSTRRISSFASNVSYISMIEVSRLSKECEQLSQDIKIADKKMKEILSAYHNHSSYITEGIQLITKAEAKLNGKPSPGENVLAALPIKEHFEQTRNGVSQRIEALEKKISRLQNASRVFNFAVRFVGNGSTVFTPSKEFELNKKSDYVMFDFKTNISKGGMFYVVTSQSDLSKSMRFFVASGKLCSSTDFGLGPNTLCHPSKVANGEWFRALFTRYEKFYSLSLIAEDGQYTTVNMTSTQIARDQGYNEDTTIYLGGIPPDVLTGVVAYYGFYDGVLDHLRINTETFHLWQPEQKYGQALFHVSRRFAQRPPGPKYAASFFGTGGLWHKMGRFSVNASTFGIAMEFRTLHKNGMLLEVLSGNDMPLLDVFLKDGHLKAVVRISLSKEVMLTSQRTTYDSSEWYNLTLMASLNETTLSITNTQSQDTRTAQHEERSSLPDGSVLVIGGSGGNSSLITGRMSFAGDIRNLRLSNHTRLQSLILRDLVGPEWVEDGGVSYEGIIKEDIYPGYRFYGYLPYRGHGSYSAVESPSGMATKVQFTFKTLERNSVLLYSAVKNESSFESSRFLYIGLWDSYLYISSHNGDFSNLAPLYFKDRSLNNNMWYTVALNYTINGFDVYLNNEVIYSGWVGNVHEHLTLGKPFYVGGVEPGIYIQFPVPVHWSFEGDFHGFSVNSRDIDLLSGLSKGVSIGGIASAIVMPTLPPTMEPTAGPQCQSAPNRPRLAEDVTSARFGATSYDYNTTTPSFLGFTLTAAQQNFFKSSVVITLELRSLTKNGLVFYAADSETNPTNFFSLELIDGRLRYQFKSRTGQVSIETRKTYALNGVWYKIYLLRIFQFGAIVIPQTKEYHNNRHRSTASTITISTPFYIGGLPNHVTAPSLFHRNLTFVGCIRNAEISSSQEDVTLNMASADLKGSSVGQCYSSIEPGAYFDGGASMKFYDVSLSSDFSISLQFRTFQRSGLLLALDSSKGRGLVLQQKYGELVLNYTNDSTATTLSWMPSSNSSPDSYLICQLKWYHVQIMKQGRKISMVINKVFEVTNDLFDSEAGLNGTLSLGHLTESSFGTSAEPFYGCLKHVYIDGVLLDISRPSTQENTELSCPVEDELDRN